MQSIKIPKDDLNLIIQQLEEQIRYYKAYLESPPPVALTEEQRQAEEMKQRMVDAGMATFE